MSLATGLTLSTMSGKDVLTEAAGVRDEQTPARRLGRSSQEVSMDQEGITSPALYAAHPAQVGKKEPINTNNNNKCLRGTATGKWVYIPIHKSYYCSKIFAVSSHFYFSLTLWEFCNNVRAFPFLQTAP